MQIFWNSWTAQTAIGIGFDWSAPNFPGGTFNLSISQAITTGATAAMAMGAAASVSQHVTTGVTDAEQMLSAPSILQPATVGVVDSEIMIAADSISQNASTGASEAVKTKASISQAATTGATVNENVAASPAITQDASLAASEATAMQAIAGIISSSTVDALADGVIQGAVFDVSISQAISSGLTLSESMHGTMIISSSLTGAPSASIESTQAPHSSVLAHSGAINTEKMRAAGFIASGIAGSVAASAVTKKSGVIIAADTTFAVASYVLILSSHINSAANVSGVIAESMTATRAIQQTTLLAILARSAMICAGTNSFSVAVSSSLTMVAPDHISSHCSAGCMAQVKMVSATSILSHANTNESASPGMVARGQIDATASTTEESKFAAHLSSTFLFSAGVFVSEGCIADLRIDDAIFGHVKSFIGVVRIETDYSTEKSDPNFPLLAGQNYEVQKKSDDYAVGDESENFDVIERPRNFDR